jgi:hypothetical protein
LAIAALCGGVSASHADEGVALPSREFVLNYEAAVSGLTPGQTARIWLPMPPSSDVQTASLIKLDAPGRSRIASESKYGNTMIYTEGTADEAGKTSVSASFRVRRLELQADFDALLADGPGSELFLEPDSLVPNEGKTSLLVKGRVLPDDPVQLGRFLYDLVNEHMKYSKEGTGWGRGDAEWACDSRYGNCSDFHSLFISLSRSSGMPARFEIGFPLPDARGAGEIPGYHCWALFKPKGRAWIPVDISEADKRPELVEYYFGNLTENRVTFSTGRDLVLVPPQAGPPLNFFVYPYVEVDGKPLPATQVERRFTYEDLALPE